MAGTLNIGIVGLGKLGKIRREILRSLPGIGTISSFDPRAEEPASFPSAEALITSPGVHAVIVCTPNAHLRRYVTLALESGKHVFCEKPAGIEVDDARAMRAAASARPDLTLKFGFNHRYLAHHRALKEQLARGDHGRVLWVKATYGKGQGPGFYDEWRSDRALAGGGILMDQGIHAIDLVADLLGDLRVEHAQVDTLHFRDRDVEDNVFALLRSAAGVPVSLHSSMTHWRHALAIDVATERALFELRGVRSSTRSYGEESLSVSVGWKDHFVETRTTRYDEPDFYAFRAELFDFVAAILDGRPVREGTPDDAVRVMTLIEQIYDHGRRGR